METWFPKTQFIANKTNLGSTKSFNKALNKSNGDYIIDLAADDVLLPHCVSSQIKRSKIQPIKKKVVCMKCWINYWKRKL
jgi:glycosyltransferase involved in cell wall biosynthesis